MILSDAGIFEALDDGRLVITPEPAPRLPTVAVPKTPFDRTAVNLALGPTLRIPRENVGVIIDPQRGEAARTLHTLYDEQPIAPDGYILRPNRFILGATHEVVSLTLPQDLPDDVAVKGCLAGRVEGKSSLARFGLLVHFTAPTIHAGFSGTITLEMMNLGPAPILLTSGMMICQLILEQVVGNPLSGGGQFQGQRNVVGVIET